MKKKSFLFVLTSLSLLFLTKPVLAEESVTVQDTEKMIQKMSAQAQALESQMKTLNSQIKKLKAEQKSLQSEVSSEKMMAQNNTQTTMPANHMVIDAPANTPVSLQTKTPAKMNKALLKDIEVRPAPQPLPEYLTGVPVTIAPYLGSHVSFSPFDLVVTYSNYMENLRMLKLRANVYNACDSCHISEPSSPILMLSGKIEGTVDYQQAYNGDHMSKVDLSAAELDLIPVINHWAGGFISFKYDNSQVPNTPLTSNSRIHLDQGFLTLGDLHISPVYFTIGQFYVPFGSYSSLMISAPITQLIFQTRARAVELAYEQSQGLYAQVFAFNGDTNSQNNNNINNLGANIGVAYSDNDNWSINASMGVIDDVADSLGMQQTGFPVGSGFTGFSVAGWESLARQVPGFSTHINFDIGNFGMNTEYITAVSSFQPQDLMFNNQGASPAAVNIEGFYNFHVINRPSAFVVSYGQSWQALALGMPQYRYEASFLTSIWKDTLQQIEFRHDINYQPGDTAGGAGAITPTSAIGGSANTVTLLLGIYF